MLGENDNLGTGATFTPSRPALFLPVAVVAAGYAALLFFLLVTGKSGSGIGRLSVIVLSVGVPLLFAHAVLRYFTIRLQPQAHMLFLQTGFPRTEPLEIPYPLIRDIRIRRGLAGRLTGSGTLVFRLVSGQPLAVCDLQNPDAAKAEIERLMDGAEFDRTPGEDDGEAISTAASNR